jgi:hypothetical protein
MVFLHHCSHNRFNTEWMKSYAYGNSSTGGDDSDLSPDDAAPTGRLLTEDDHHALAIEYIGGFMRWRLKGENALAGLFNGTMANTRNAETTLQWSFGTSVKIVDDLENPNQSTIGGRVVTEGVVNQFANITIDHVKQASRTLHQTGVLAVNPNLAGPTPGVLRFAFSPPNDQDWSQFDALLLRVTANFELTDPATIAAGKLPEFEIVLQDTSMAVARLDQSSFNPPLTRPVFHKLKSGTNVTRLKLQTVRVPLSSFQGVALSRISGLEIHPGANFPTHLFFDSLELVKEK